MMKERFVLSTALAAFLLVPAALFPESPKIASIRVDGLKRTNLRTVERLLSHFIGMPASEVDADDVSAILIGTGVFENVRAIAVSEGDGARARLEVSLDEKWSIIPIPVFVATAKGITAGAAVIDANAFGNNDKLLAVGLILPTGWMASAAFIDEKNGTGSRSNSFAAYISTKEREDEDASERTLRRYRSTAADLAYETSFSVFPQTTASVSFSFRSRGVSSSSDEPLAPPEGARALTGKFGLSSRSSSWNGTFLSESYIGAGAAYSFALEGTSFWSADFRTAFEKPLTRFLRLRAHAAGMLAPASPAAFDLTPSSLGSTILPSYFAARDAAAGSLGLEARIAKLPFGLVSALASYEAAALRGDLIGETFAHGPSGGLRVYVAKIAVPAMGIVVSYNVPTGLVQASFGIGMRM